MTRLQVMARSRRWVLLVVGMPLLVIGALLFAAQLPAVRDRARGWAESALARRIGRELRAERVDVKLLQGRLELHKVRVASGRSLADGTLLEIDAIGLTWRWSALLRRSLVLRQVRLVQPRLSLRLAESAGTPWAGWLTVLLEVGPPAPDAWTIDISRVDIQDGTVAWETKGSPGRLDGVQGFFERRSQDGTAVLGGDLRAARFLLPWEGAVREVTELSVQADATPQIVRIAAAKAAIDGARVVGEGRILDPAGVGQLDLALTVSSPAAALLKNVGVSRDVDGRLSATGHLRGPWNRPVFQGQGVVQLAKTRRKADAIVFDLRWADGRLEFEAPDGRKPDSAWWKFALEPATGVYRAHLKVHGTDLDRLTGLPALAARLAGFELPAEVGGRLVADVDLTGRGTDLATLRGYGALRVEDLRVEAGLPAGRLEARISASASQLAVQTLSLDVPGGTVRGKGTVTFADGQVDLPFDADIRSASAFGRGFGLPLLGGNATLAGRLTGTRDAPRLQGHLAWREPRVGLYGADTIEGEIEWLPRTVRSSRLAVRLGQTVATFQGSAVAVGSAPLRSLDLRRDVTLDLQGRVNPGRTADLAQFLPAGLDVHGTFTGNGRLAGTPQALTAEIEVACTNLQTWQEKWQRGEAIIRFVPGAVEISRLSVQRGTERVTGDFRFGKGGTLSGRFASASVELGGAAILAGTQLTGRAALHGEVQGTVHEPRTVGGATVDALRFRTVPLGPGVATFTVDGKTVDIDLALGSGSQRVRLHLDPAPERGLRLQVDLSDGDLAPLLALAEVELLRTTPVRGTGRILMHGAANDFAHAGGEARLSALHLQWDGEAWSNRGPVDVTWRGRAVNLRQVRLASRDRTLDLQGTVGPDGQADLQAKGRLPLLALAARLPVIQPAAGTAVADLQIRGSLKAPDIRGTVHVVDGRLALAGVPAPFEDVQGTVDLENERAFIRSLEGKLAGGTVRATGDVSRHGDEWSVRAAVQADGNRVEQLLAGVTAGKGGDVTGTLTVGGTLTSRGRGGEGFWPNLGGDLKLILRDGRLGRQTLTVRILSLMNLAELLDLKTAGVAGPGIPYRRLTSDITIENGVARTENLLLESSAFNLSAVGHVDLARETVEMDVAVKPFGTMDKVMTAIPLAGWLLGGKDAALIAAFYRVTGPLSDPKVTSLPMKSISRNTFGTFRRLLELPEAVTAP